VKIEIKDTGIGMDEKEIPRIFNRYYSKSAGKRLQVRESDWHLPRNFIELHNGKIYVDSESRKRFNIYGNCSRLSKTRQKR